VKSVDDWRKRENTYKEQTLGLGKYYGASLGDVHDLRSGGSEAIVTEN
jgi:hypothetical protein